MDEAQAHIILTVYEGLEAKASDLRKHVPPVGSNSSTWSPTLAEIIVGGCGLIDSTFRRYGSENVSLNSRKKPRADLCINDYCALWRDKYAFDSQKVIYLASPPEYRVPFLDWKEHAPLTWWKVYTALKHDYIEAMAEATWDTAIDVLAAATLVMSRSWELVREMMRRDWLDSSIKPDMVLASVRDGVKTPRYPFSIHTRLFCIIHGGDPLPADIRFFRPSNYGKSSRLINYFCRS